MVPHSDWNVVLAVPFSQSPKSLFKLLTYKNTLLLAITIARSPFSYKAPYHTILEVHTEYSYLLEIPAEGHFLISLFMVTF